MASTDLLAPLALFRDLTAAQREYILGLMTRREIGRGEALVEEGQDSDALYIVLHGAFEVLRAEVGGAIAWLRAGDVVGEIGFFADTPRTATVRATRDATVLELDRDAYEQVSREAPAIGSSLLGVLARRLDVTSARLSSGGRRPAERTIAVVRGGDAPVEPLFFERLRQALTAAGARVIDHDKLSRQFGRGGSDAEITAWLNAQEWEGRLLVFFADEALTDWTRRCVRQADQVAMVTRGEAPAQLSEVEAFASEIHAPEARRLVRVHDERVGVVSGTSAWLDRLPVGQHHHVALSDDADFQSLARFFTGRATGFVAAGGGAFGPAHVGIFKAFVERGVTFDAYIGTSVGSAMLAGFAMRHDAAHLDNGTHEIFVKARSFKRPSWPRYALLDHKAFDAALQEAYGATTLIEDCWHPFCAVATNLSTQQVELIRRGLVWKAVRASAAIPAVLPPVFTDNGEMLVDGGVMDNAPLGPMQALKSGPNLVVHFGRTDVQRFDVDYDALPGRWQLLNAMLNPFSRRRLPRAPNAVNVLMRSLFVHQRYDLPAGPTDLVLRPPPFPGSSFLDFDQHTQVFHASYEWAKETLAALEEAGDEALQALDGQQVQAKAAAAAA